MIKKVILDWEKNKSLIEDWFKKGHPDSYKSIVSKIFEVVITYKKYDVENLVEIDHGDYQGCQVYLIPEDTYEPNPDDYVWTENYYGSCSGCDTLESIRGYDDSPTDEEQVKEYMQLTLHLIQKIKPLVGKR